MENLVEEVGRSGQYAEVALSLHDNKQEVSTHEHATRIEKKVKKKIFRSLYGRCCNKLCR